MRARATFPSLGEASAQCPSCCCSRADARRPWLDALPLHCQGCILRCSIHGVDSEAEDRVRKTVASVSEGSQQTRSRGSGHAREVVLGIVSRFGRWQPEHDRSCRGVRGWMDWEMGRPRRSLVALMAGWRGRTALRMWADGRMASTTARVKCIARRLHRGLGRWKKTWVGNVCTAVNGVRSMGRAVYRRSPPRRRNNARW